MNNESIPYRALLPARADPTMPWYNHNSNGIFDIIAFPPQQEFDTII